MGEAFAILIGCVILGAAAARTAYWALMEAEATVLSGGIGVVSVALTVVFVLTAVFGPVERAASGKKLTDLHQQRMVLAAAIVGGVNSTTVLKDVLEFNQTVMAHRKSVLFLGGLFACEGWETLTPLEFEVEVRGK